MHRAQLYVFFLSKRCGMRDLFAALLELHEAGNFELDRLTNEAAMAEDDGEYVKY